MSVPYGADLPFVGRGPDLAALRGLYERGSRLVSVVGPGGVGKTRLAVELCRALEADGRDVSWIGFADEPADADVASVVAQALRLAADAGSSRELAVRAALEGGGPRWVVLDSVEHLGDEIGRFLEGCLVSAPRCRFLLTSRQQLRLPSEYVLDLAPLALPPGGADLEAVRAAPSVALFIELARRHDVHFDAEDDDVRVIASLVRELDGLPLAIELAAARVDLLSVEQLCRRVRDDVLLLSSPTAAGARHHQALQTTLEWSWSLLTDEEALALAELSVFRGGFELAHVEEILSCGKDRAMDVLRGLRDKSLVVYDRATERLRLLTLVREYAAGKLADAEAVRARHRRCFAALAAQWHDAREISSEHLPHLVRERANLETVLQYCDLDDPEHIQDAVHVCLALFALARMSGSRERFAARLDTILSASSIGAVTADLVGELHFARGVMSNRASERAARSSHYQRALELAAEAGAAELKARVVILMALDGLIPGEPETIRHMLEDELETAMAGGRHLLAGELLMSLGCALGEHEHLDEAREHFERALAVFSGLGHLRWQGHALGNLGSVCLDEGRLADATRYLRRAVDVLSRAGDENGETYVHLSLAAIEHLSGRLGPARELYEKCATCWAEVGHRSHEARALGALGSVLADLDDLESAQEQLARAAAARDDSGGHLPELKLHRAHLDLAEARGLVVASSTGQADRMRAKAVRVLDAASDEPSSYWLRISRRILRSVLARDACASASVLDIDGVAAIVRLPTGQSIDLASRATLWRVLMALAVARCESPGQGTSSDDLFRAGWPDQNIARDAAQNRVRAAIAALRRVGLREYLLTSSDGYYIDPLITIRVESGG